VKVLTGDLIGQKNTLAGTEDGPWIWLIELDRDGTNSLYYAKTRGADVTFNSQTYTRRGMAVEPAKSDAAGGTINFTVTLQDVDQALLAYLEAGELSDRPMLLTQVHKDHLSSASNRIDIRGMVISADANENSVTLTCGNYDLRAVRIPNDTYSQLRCRWVYKSDECGSAHADSSCLKEPNDCENTKDNISRIGCFIGMPLIKP